MLLGIFQYSKASQNVGIHVAPQNLMTSWQAHKGHISSTTRNQRLMKSHWIFLRPWERQCLHGFFTAETNTLGSPRLCSIQRSALSVLLSILYWNMHWCHETEWSSSCFIGNSIQKSSPWRTSQAPALSEKQLRPVSPSCPWMHSGYFQPLEITTSWFSSSSLPEGLSTLHNPMPVRDVWEWRVRKDASLISLFLKYVLLSLCMFSVVTLWGEDEWHRPEDGRGTDASRVIMTSRRQLNNSCDSGHANGPEATKEMFCERYST